MDKHTLAALKGSIAKWRGIVAGTEADHGTQNCPLCHEFIDHDECDGCPVADRSGRGSCEGTPYWDFYNAAGGLYAFANTPELKALAQDELDFLTSLLPTVGRHRTNNKRLPARNNLRRRA